MSHSCFVCPIYDSHNHFDFGYDLVESYLKLKVETDLIFVFTNQEQSDKFTKNCQEKFNYEVKGIILPAELEHYKSKVVAKKFYALKLLKDQYDYISLIDCETKFIKNTDFDKLFKEIDDKRLCLNSNISYDGFFILRTCFKTMGLYKNKKLRKEFRNFKYNFWFNEIQVYNCRELDGFFPWLEQFDKNGYLNEWNCFEYYIFAAYLILEKNVKLNRFPSLKSMGGIMEYIGAFDEKKQAKVMKTLNTHWTSGDVYLDDTYIRFHLDRVDHNGYSYKNNKLKLKLRRLLILLLGK